MDGRINVHSPAVAIATGGVVANEGRRHDAPAVIARAREMTANVKPSKKAYLSPTFGYIVQWLSEVAGPPDLDALLLHADTYLNPSWSKGGLSYARCYNCWDKDGNYTYVDPYTGNAAIGYARLNVKDGQKKMWDRPWTREDSENRPWIDGVGLEQGVDCLRGRWDEEQQAWLRLSGVGTGKRGHPAGGQSVATGDLWCLCWWRTLEGGSFGVTLGGDCCES
jgi:hypothetical protein